MPLGVPRRARAGVAAGLAVACLALTPASASAAGPSVRSQQWWLSALHVTQAQQSTRGAGVTVAVLDTGIYPGQADLKGAVTTGPDYTSSSRVSGGPFWGLHGTALASLIAGRGHGRGHAAGILGVAPAASILSVRVTLESDDPLLSDVHVAAALPGAIARGIRYAVSHHATVIDLPLDPITAAGAPGAGGSAAERSAVADALAHHVVLVAPAGDQGDTTDPVNFPAAYPGVISVGAFNAVFTKAAFSSRRPYVTLTAAGDGVIAASGPTGYAVMSSTAAASAVVAGIVALIRAQFPALSPAQVTKALTESTVFHHPGGQQDGSGAGTVDAAKALAAAARVSEAVPTAGPSPTGAAVPPSAPPAHASSGLRNTLLLDIGIALGLFLLLAVPILGYGTYRRRRARAARLAEVRAAAQPVARRPQVVAVGTGHSAIATPEPEHAYSPAPAGEEPTDVIAPYTSAGRARAQPPWAPWDSQGGPGDSGGTAGSGVQGIGVQDSGVQDSGMQGSGVQDISGPGTAAPRSGPPESGLSESGAPGSRPPGSGPPGSPLGGGPPSSGFPGSAFPGRAFQGTARRSATAGPDGRPSLPSRPGLPSRIRRDAEDPAGAGWSAAPGGRAAYGGPPGAGWADDGPGQPGSAPDGPAHGEEAVSGSAPGGYAPGGDVGADFTPTAPGTAGGGLMASHRTGAPHTPKVSGSPPWEPAPEPPGEVPWGRSAIPSAGGGPMFASGPQQPPAPQPSPAAPPQPAVSSWDEIAEEAWPGGPGATRSQPPPSDRRPPGSRGRRGDPGSGQYDDEPATSSQPIYVWNPHVTTENLPAVKPGENHRGENHRRLRPRPGKPVRDCGENHR